MLIFPFQSNSKGSLLCVKSELYILRILKKTKKKILLHLGTNDPTSFFSFNTYRFKIKAIYLSRSINRSLLYRYWWNTRIFPFTKKSYLHCAQRRYHFYLSRVRILVSPWLLTWLANYNRAMNKKKSCVLCRNFISIYIINRTFHGRFPLSQCGHEISSISINSILTFCFLIYLVILF